MGEALEAYVEADKACDKAHDAWRIAQQRLLARQEALERIIVAAARERDALETIIPEVNPVMPGDRFVLRGGHDPATCRDGDHYGQCSGVTR
jgi:hypothetical protein